MDSSSDLPNGKASTPALQCFRCKHLVIWPYCFAFLTGPGIPDEILLGEFDHTRPHPQDHGIRFLSEESPYGLSPTGMKRLLHDYIGEVVMPELAAFSDPEPEPVSETDSVAAALPASQPGDLIEACARGDVGRVRQLLSEGADVNFSDLQGGTALMAASRNCDLELVKMLLEHGADVNAEDRTGRTALYIAGAWGYPSIAELLRKHGATEPESSESIR